MPRLNQNQQIQALTMLARGDNVSNVSRAFGCHRDTIIRLCQRFQQTGWVADRRRPGRPRVTNPRLDRFITLRHRFQTATSSERDRFGSESVMVCDGIVDRRKTNLIVVQGNLNSQGYIYQILYPEAVPFLQRYGPAILVNARARPHVARICRQFLNRNNVNVLTWPAVSPDMNPIEDIWDYLGRKVRARGNVHNLRDLENASRMENIFNVVIRRYVRSMRGRLAACINSRGGHTRY